MTLLSVVTKESQTPGSCSGESSSSEQLDHLGFNIEFRTYGVVETWRMVMRLVTHTLYFNIGNGTGPITSPQYQPDYVDSVGVYFNRGTPSISIFPLVTSGSETTSTRRWIVDSQELMPYGIPGSGIMQMRKEYLCEGTWQKVDYAYGYSTVGHGFQLTYDTEEEVGPFYNSVQWKNQTKSERNVVSTAPGTVITSTAVPQDKGFKQRMFRINRSYLIKDLTQVTSPTNKIPNPGIASLLGFMNGNEYEPDTGMTNVGTMDGSRSFRLISESIEPYDKQGGGMLRWTQEYMNIVATSSSVSDSWREYSTFVLS